MTRFLTLLLFALVSVSAGAAVVDAIIVTKYTVNYGPAAGNYYDSPSIACSVAIPDDVFVNGYCATPSGVNHIQPSAANVRTCPAGGSINPANNNQCIIPDSCPDPEHQLTNSSGVCYKPNCSQSHPPTWQWSRTEFNKPGSDGCSAPPPPAACPYGQTDGGVDASTNVRKCTPRVCPYPSVLKADGTCGADDNVKPDLVCPSGTHKNMASTRCEPNAKDEPDPCPVGTHNISANAALPNCTSDSPPPDKPPEVTKSDTKVQPDGSTTKTETTQGSASNNDGTATVTTTTTTTTVNASGQPVGSPMVTVRKTTVLDGSGTPGTPAGRPTGTVTTVTAGDGTQTTSTTKGTAPGDNPDAKETDLCKLHPTLNICKNSAVSGDCENLVCEGDAIQCAILRQQKKEYCDNIKDNPLKTLGDQLLNGSDPLKATLPTPENGTEVTINGNIEAAGWLGGGACISDKSFPLAGHTIVIPFSRVCDGLVAFRLAVMLMALMASFRMMSGAILRA